VTDDRRWMLEALAEAARAAAAGEVPVGCVLVSPAGVELARAHNLREALEDPTAHAEVLAMRAAAAALGTWRLEGVTAYVTLEPCVMCAGALVNARIGRVVYGCDDPKAGALASLYRVGEDARLNHRYPVVAGVEAEACAEVLRAFFRARRKGSALTGG
jgi:tRNA(adenine34) deaminase